MDYSVKIISSIIAAVMLSACGSAPQAKPPQKESPTERAQAYFDDLTAKAAYPLMSGLVVDSGSTLFSGLAGDHALPEYQGFAERAAGSTAFYVYSVNKTITALAILQLEEEGKLDIDDMLSKWLDFLPWDASLRQVMSHSSGIPDPFIGNGYIHFEEERASFDPDALIRKAVKANPRLRFAPGKSVAYSNLGYALLGMVIEKASGERYQDRIRRKVFEPLGIDPSEASYDPDETPSLAGSYISANIFTEAFIKAVIPRERFSKTGRWKTLRKKYWFDFPSHGGLIASPAALAKFLQAALKRDGRLLGPAGWEEYFKPQAASRDGKTVFALSWSVCESRGIRRYEHTGGAFGNSAVISIYPDNNVASVWIGNRIDSFSVVQKDRPFLDGLFLTETR